MSNERAGVFARVSTDDQATDGKYAISGQLSATRQYAERLGFEVIEEFVEEGVSGALEYRQRPEVSRLLDLAERRGLDAVIWAYADRQGRSVVEVSLIEAELRRYGVEVHLVEGGKRDRATADGVLVEGVRDLVAEAERLRIAQRTTGGRYAKAKAGQWVGGGALPMGYAKSAGGLLVEDPETAEIVRYAYALAGKGDTLSTVTRRLNGEFPDFEGQRGAVGFAAGSVKRWLTLPGYKGEGFAQLVKKAPREQREEFVAPAPALVSPEEWADAVASLTRSRKAWRATHNRPEGEASEEGYSLAGRIYHVHVKSGPVALFGVTPGRKDAKRRTRLYRCSHSTARYKERFKSRDEFDACEGWGVNPQNKKRRRISVRAAEIEARTILELVEAFKSAEALRELRDREDRRALAIKETEDTLTAAYRERDTLDAEELNLAKRLGRLSETAADAALDDFDARRTANAERVARLEDDADDLADLGATVEAVAAVTVDYIGVSPGDGVKVMAEFGTLKMDIIKVGPVWLRLMALLADEAEEVVAGNRPELSTEARGWLDQMVSRFGVSVTIEHGEGTAFAYAFAADRGLVFGRRTETVPSFEAGTLIVNPKRRP